MIPVQTVHIAATPGPAIAVHSRAQAAPYSSSAARTRPLPALCHRPRPAPATPIPTAMDTTNTRIGIRHPGILDRHPVRELYDPAGPRVLKLTPRLLRFAPVRPPIRSEGFDSRTFPFGVIRNRGFRTCTSFLRLLLIAAPPHLPAVAIHSRARSAPRSAFAVRTHPLPAAHHTPQPGAACPPSVPRSSRCAPGHPTARALDRSICPHLLIPKPPELPTPHMEKRKGGEHKRSIPTLPWSLMPLPLQRPALPLRQIQCLSRYPYPLPVSSHRADVESAWVLPL